MKSLVVIFGVSAAVVFFLNMIRMLSMGIVNQILEKYGTVIRLVA